MAIYRIFPSADTWITNRLIDSSITVRATGSNHGRTPALNVFAFEPAQLSGTMDLARILLQFDTTELSGKIYDDGIIPSSSVSYVLKMFDERHGDTVPTSYDLFAFPLSRSWDEGVGIDDDLDRDKGFANWIQPVSTADWVATGSDFLADEGSGSQHFDGGSEDLSMDVSDLVMNWLTGTFGNNGLVVKMGDTEEDSGYYFRKVFHGRETLYVENLPYIEARWDSVAKDHRHNFAFDNDSNLFLYNFVRGELVDLTEPITVRIQDHITGVSASYAQEFTASWVSTGVYSASINIEATASFSGTDWNDIWFSGSRAYMTGTMTPLVLTGSQVDQYDEFDLDVTNLKRVYGVDEEVRLKVHVRKRDWVTHVGVMQSASLEIETECIEKLYYAVRNDETGDMIIPFGTGSVPHTQTSYNSDGNYFDLWMNSFVPGFKYRLLFLIDINRDKKIIDDGIVFKVV